eukprot:scaffold28807_cov67-Phaeocystis_antarctica.AAC.16
MPCQAEFALASIPLGLLRSVHRHQNAAREVGTVVLSPARPHVIRGRHANAMRQRAVGRAVASHAASPSSTASGARAGQPLRRGRMAWPARVVRRGTCRRRRRARAALSARPRSLPPSSRARHRAQYGAGQPSPGGGGLPCPCGFPAGRSGARAAVLVLAGVLAVQPLPARRDDPPAAAQSAPALLSVGHAQRPRGHARHHARALVLLRAITARRLVDDAPAAGGPRIGLVRGLVQARPRGDARDSGRLHAVRCQPSPRRPHLPIVHGGLTHPSLVAEPSAASTEPSACCGLPDAPRPVSRPLLAASGAAAPPPRRAARRGAEAARRPCGLARRRPRSRRRSGRPRAVCPRARRTMARACGLVATDGRAAARPRHLGRGRAPRGRTAAPREALALARGEHARATSCGREREARCRAAGGRPLAAALGDSADGIDAAAPRRCGAARHLPRARLVAARRRPVGCSCRVCGAHPRRPRVAVVLQQHRQRAGRPGRRVVPGGRACERAGGRAGQRRRVYGALRCGSRA